MLVEKDLKYPRDQPLTWEEPSCLLDMNREHSVFSGIFLLLGVKIFKEPLSFF